MLQRLPVHVENLGCASHISLRVLKTSGDVTSFKLAPIFTEVGSKRDAYSITFAPHPVNNPQGIEPGNTGRDLVGQITNFLFRHPSQ